MTLEELTLEVLAQRVLTPFDSKKLVEWAVKVLETGYENEHLYILAGLDFESTEEREAYFHKSMEAFKLTIERSTEELLLHYALIIAKKAISKEINARYALGEMLKVVSASEYDSRYMAFYEIDEDLDYLAHTNSLIFNGGLSLENAEDFIREEMSVFVQMENLKIPMAERQQSYCEACKRLNTPILKNKYQLKRPFRFMAWSCGLCGSGKLKHNSDHQVKRMIIEKYGSPIAGKH